MDINSRTISHHRMIAGTIFIVLFLFLQLIFPVDITGIRPNKTQENTIALLLDSGLTHCQSSRLKYIIWSEELQNQTEIEKILISSGLSWHKEILSDFSGNKALKYSAACSATRETEEDYLDRYHTLYYQLDDSKTKVYLEERIDEAIDIRDYYRTNGITVIQNNTMASITSLTGELWSLPQSIRAGDSRICIQGITKTNTDDQGKTIIALPALFEEF